MENVPGTTVIPTDQEATDTVDVKLLHIMRFKNKTKSKAVMQK